MLQITVMSVLALVLLGIYQGIKVELNHQFFLALHGVFLEGLVLLGVSLFFSIFATPMMVVAFALGLFLIGHWLESLAYFTKKGQGLLAVLAQYLPKIVPDLEAFNWRSAVIHGDAIGAETVGWASVYALGWFALLIAVAAFIFKKRDFG